MFEFLSRLFSKNKVKQGYSDNYTDGINHQFERYSRNQNLKQIDKDCIDENTYPSEFVDPDIHLEAFTNGDIFQIQTINGIEYILAVCQDHAVISAYDTKGHNRARVGGALYRYLDYDKGLYLDDLIVCPNCRTNQIGTNIVKSLIYAEYEYLKNHNIFVHAKAFESSKNALTQPQLEHFYETKGFTLVTNDSDVYGDNDFMNPVDNEYLQAIVQEAISRSGH